MKIAVIGAGAMGCYFGSLFSKNNEVVFIDAFDKQINDINENGVTIKDYDGEILNFKNVKAYKSGSYKENVDLVIVLVKSTSTNEALEANKFLFTDTTIVLTMQNGAGNDRKIAKFAKPENIIIGTTTHNCTNLGNATTSHNGPGYTTIGSNYNNIELLNKIENLFIDINSEILVSNDIQRVIWTKLFVNLSINTFTALIQTPIGYMVKNESAWNFAKRLIYEAVEVAEADGTYFDRREALEMVRNVCIDAGNGFSSMYQDRKRKVKMEIDAINGAIVEQAKIYGVPTPYNSLIVDLIHAVEGAYDYYD